jgi:hypothetical protein
VKLEVHQMPPGQWALYSEDAHKICFSEKRPWQMDRIDFALVAVDTDKRDPLGYVTVRELDSESVYWQYGGAFPSSEKSLWAYKAYEKFVKWTKERYSRVTTLVESENVRYLKMAMSVGFRVIGVRIFKGQVLCELLLEFKKGESK